MSEQNKEQTQPNVKFLTTFNLWNKCLEKLEITQIKSSSLLAIVGTKKEKRVKTKFLTLLNCRKKILKQIETHPITKFTTILNCREKKRKKT